MKILLILLLSFTGNCFADATAIFIGTAGGRSENVKAQFTSSALGDLMLQIWNYLPDPGNTNQVIYGLSFSVQGVGGSVSTFSGTGDLIQINHGGTVTPKGDDQNITSSTMWTASTSLTDATAQVMLDARNSGADYGIVGGTGSNSLYDGAPANLTSSGHNPFVDETATFTLHGLTGFTSTDDITNVIFSFGTTKGALDVSANTLLNYHGVASPVPEPSTWGFALLGSCLLLAGYRFRARRA